jgi:hypothetical protein
MPRGDRTGPEGRGPMTGRAAGYCAGYDVPGHANPIPGRGSGFGRSGGWGRGRRWRHWFRAPGLPPWARVGARPRGGPVPDAPPAPEEEAESLKEQAAWLKGQLDAVNRRITDLERES